MSWNRHRVPKGCFDNHTVNRLCEALGYGLKLTNMTTSCSNIYTCTKNVY